MIVDREYRENSGISNSLIKEFQKLGCKEFYNQYLDPNRKIIARQGTESTDIGDLVDCLTTTPKLFSELYYVSADVKVSPAIRTILDNANRVAAESLRSRGLAEDRIYEHPAMRNIDDAQVYIIKAAREYEDPKKPGEVGYYNNKTDESLYAGIKKDGEAYYGDLATANGRKIIDQQLYNIALNKQEELKQHEEYGKIFDQKPPEHVERKFQYAIYLELDGIRVKILLDQCDINHKTKIVYPLDVKTALNRDQFNRNYINFGYPNQGSFYSAVLKAKYPGYQVANFKFITVFTDSNEKALTYMMSDNELKVAEHGAVLKSGTQIRGWRNVLSDIQQHMKSGDWEYPIGYKEKGFISLDMYNTDSIASFTGVDADVI